MATTVHLLIADDSPTNRLHLRLLSERLGHTVTEAATGREALDRLGERRPDLIMLDLRLPDFDAEALLAQLAEAPAGRGVPVVVVGDPDEHEALDRCLARGASGPLLRPFDAEALDAQIQAIPKMPQPEAEDSPRAVIGLLSHLGHDLHTPLNAILGFSEMLKDEANDMGEASFAKDLGKIHTAGRRMLAMVDQLVDLARVEAGSLTLEAQPCSLSEVISLAFDDLSATASGRSIELIWRLDPGAPRTIAIDPGRLREVIATFAGAAVQHGPPGRVELVASGGPDGLALLSLAAPGFGLNAEELAQVLGPLGRADPALLHRHGGESLGLVLARRLCNLMGGTVQVEPGPGEAVTLRLALGIGDAPQLDPPALVPKPQAAVRSEPPLRILLAEDSPVNQSLFLNMLKHLGRDAEVASNGLEVLEALRQKSFDVILMDVQMPELDGLETSRRIRDDFPSGRKPRIVALTAHSSPEDRRACQAAGMDDYLAKPIQSRELQAALDRCTP